MNFLVLCSSNGTTFQAILDRIADGSLTARCVGLITDRHDRGCIEKAKRAGVPFCIVPKDKEVSMEEYDKRLYEEILSFEPPSICNSEHVMVSPTNHDMHRIVAVRRAHCDNSEYSTDISLIACIGWMHIFSPWFIRQFPNRILNVHPALLPKYGGRGMYGLNVHEAVLKNHEHESGMTIHIVTKEVDQGPILLQKKCPVLLDDTPQTLQKRVQELEKEWYPKVLQTLVSPPPTRTPPP